MRPRNVGRSLRHLLGAGAFIAVFGWLVPHAGAWEGEFPTYEAYMDYTHSYPYAGEHDWTEEFQGLTHDADHWYLTQSKLLFRVPVWKDLDQDIKGDEGVDRIFMENIPELWPDYNHFGDPCFYDPDESDAHPGYVLVPVTGEDKIRSGLAMFRADASLDLVDFELYPEEGGQDHYAGWVAVGPEGLVYGSRNDIDVLQVYTVEWEVLQNSGELHMDHVGTLPLFDENGIEPYEMNKMQGGVITASGEVIYLSAGVNDCEPDYNMGIFAFEMATGKLIARSCQTGCFFRYQFECNNRWDEEPEGMTIWDLDDGRAPGISGQLHVSLLDNDAGQDNVYIKHFTMRRYLEPGDGIQDEYDEIFDHAELNFAPGTYEEAITVGTDGTKDMLFVAPDGPVLIR